METGSESAFLLKAQLEEELRNYENRRYAIPALEIPDEESDLTQIRTYLSAGSEILLCRLGDRESEASEYFKKGLSILNKLRDKFDHAVEEREAAARAQQKMQAEQDGKLVRKMLKGVCLVWGIMTAIPVIFFGLNDGAGAAALAGLMFGLIFAFAIVSVFFLFWFWG